MAFYEHMFLARQDIAPQKIDELLKVYKEIAEAHGGRIEHSENWGLRPIAYAIRKNRKAYYVLVNIDAPSSAISEIERKMRINEDVLRYMTIRVEKYEQTRSATSSHFEQNDSFDKNEQLNTQHDQYDNTSEGTE